MKKWTDEEILFLRRSWMDVTREHAADHIRELQDAVDGLLALIQSQCWVLAHEYVRLNFNNWESETSIELHVPKGEENTMTKTTPEEATEENRGDLKPIEHGGKTIQVVKADILDPLQGTYEGKYYRTLSVDPQAVDELARWHAWIEANPDININYLPRFFFSAGVILGLRLRDAQEK